MSESEYKMLVLADYDRQMEAQLLPSELLVPTPANIKAEIVKFCEHRSELIAGDENILRSFVGERHDTAAYRIAFQNGKADPFRQVVKVLADRSVNTNIKYINLLALLIGFPSRPYHPNLRSFNPLQAEAMHSPPAKGNPSPSNIPTERDGHITGRNNLKFVWIFASAIVIALGWFVIPHKTVRHYTGHEGCMFWNDDHYEPIECNDRSLTAAHYQIKLEQVDNFKRITKPDTLTYKSVRKVWYSNYKGKMEFYTDSGANPLDTNLRVLPMSKHIFEKYVLHITN